MTFRKELRGHRGGLLRLKTGIYWYGGRGWDERLGLVCLLLDAKTCYSVRAYVDACGRNAAFGGGGDGDAGALLFVDGAPRWIKLNKHDVEIL